MNTVKLPQDVEQYIKSLELKHLQWFPVSKETPDQMGFVLLIIRYDEQLAIELGKASGYSFMTADDLSWVGPTRNVAAWASINI